MSFSFKGLVKKILYFWADEAKLQLTCVLKDSINVVVGD
jgi:hypothetical protein